jgi:hypothetical protein
MLRMCETLGSTSDTNKKDEKIPSSDDEVTSVAQMIKKRKKCYYMFKNPLFEIQIQMSEVSEREYIHVGWFPTVKQITFLQQTYQLKLALC